MNEYLQRMRALAQSVLAGIQRLEELGATLDDDSHSNAKHSLEEADSDVWALVDWVADGRKDS